MELFIYIKNFGRRWSNARQLGSPELGNALDTWNEKLAEIWQLIIQTRPMPLSSFAGEPSQSEGKSFIKMFNMLVLVGAVKMADRVVREMMGL